MNSSLQVGYQFGMCRETMQLKVKRLAMKSLVSFVCASVCHGRVYVCVCVREREREGIHMESNLTLLHCQHMKWFLLILEEI